MALRLLFKKTTNPKIPIAATAIPIDNMSKVLKIAVGSRPLKISIKFYNPISFGSGTRFENVGFLAVILDLLIFIKYILP